MEFDRRGSDASLISMFQPLTPSFGNCSMELLKPEKTIETITSIVFPCLTCREKFVIDKPTLTVSDIQNYVAFDMFVLQCKACVTGKGLGKGKHPAGTSKGRKQKLEELEKKNARFMASQPWICCGDFIITKQDCGTRNPPTILKCTKCLHGCEEYCENYPGTDPLYPKPPPQNERGQPQQPPPPPQWHLMVHMEDVLEEQADNDNGGEGNQGPEGAGLEPENEQQ